MKKILEEFKINKKIVSPKVIVLGIDGLDYHLVEKWNLKYLLQKTHKKLDLSDYKVIVTPPIWGSMLTGKVDKEIMEKWIKRCEIYGDEENIKQKWWAILGQKILPESLSKWILQTFFKKQLGLNLFEETCNYIVEKNEKNIFDFFENPWTNGIPGYRCQEDFEKSKKLLNESVSGNHKPYVSYLNEEFEHNKKQLLSALKENTHDMLFWYTKTVDSICHAYNIKTIRLMNYYLEINSYVGEVKKSYPDSKIYVVSDHGMEKRENGYWWHSKYSFFSSNTDESVDKPTQIYNLIQKYRTVK